MCDFKDKFENVKQTVLARADDFVSKLAKNFHEFRVLSEEKRVSNFDFGGIKLYSGTDSHGKYFELRNKKTFARFHKKDGEQVLVYLQKKKGDNKVQFRALSRKPASASSQAAPGANAPIEEAPVSTSDATSTSTTTTVVVKTVNHTEKDIENTNQQIENEINQVNKEIEKSFNEVSGATEQNVQDVTEDIVLQTQLLISDGGVTVYTAGSYDVDSNDDHDIVPFNGTIPPIPSAPVIPPVSMPLPQCVTSAGGVEICPMN